MAPALDTDHEERRSPVSALGGSLHNLWEGASHAGKWVRGILSFAALLALVFTAFRGAASIYVDWSEVQPKLEAHDQRIGTLEEDTAALTGLLERMETIEETTEVQRQVLYNLEIRLDGMDTKLDRHTCLLKAIAEGRNAFGCP